MVYKSAEGIFIITGCSHSRICNIVESAKMIRDEHRVAGMIGGLQLFETDKQLDRTIDYLMNCDIKYLYPCHCVSLKAKCKMSKRLNLSEVVVGLRIDI